MYHNIMYGRKSFVLLRAKDLLMKQIVDLTNSTKNQFSTYVRRYL